MNKVTNIADKKIKQRLDILETQSKIYIENLEKLSNVVLGQGEALDNMINAHNQIMTNQNALNEQVRDIQCFLEFLTELLEKGAELKNIGAQYVKKRDTTTNSGYNLTT